MKLESGEPRRDVIRGMLTPFFILVILGLLFAVLSIPFSQYPLLAVAVILLSVALLIKGA